MCFAASLALCPPVQGFPGQWFLGEHSPTSRQLHVKAKLGVGDCLRNVWPHAWTAAPHVASAHPFACTQQVLSYSRTSESVCKWCVSHPGVGGAKATSQIISRESPAKRQMARFSTLRG